MSQAGTYQLFSSAGRRSFAMQTTLPVPIFTFSSFIPADSEDLSGSRTWKFLIAALPGEAAFLKIKSQKSHWLQTMG